MIGFLSGQVIYSEAHKIILLNNHGVGYEVYVARSCVPNQKIELFISHIIREQSQDLYGFDTIEDKKFFEMLLDVNGIGPKSAFSLVTHLGVKQIITAITLENSDSLKSAPGIGKKSAEQIVLSLKDKISKFSLGLVAQEKNSNTAPKGSDIQNLRSDFVQEALAACLGLGFKDHEVLPLIQKCLEDGSITKSEEMVKMVLKELR
jgi:Holliday junction DNA helicase RuvA